MEQIAKHLARSHDGDIEMLQLQKYSGGLLAMFKVGDQHRVAYIMFGTLNNMPYTVWDSIANK